MAKKQIKDYVFYPGVVPPAYNQYPNAVALLNANRNYIIEEIIGYLTFASGTPSVAPTTYPNAINQLTNNKAFIQEEATAWIASQVASQTPQNLAPNAYALISNNKSFIQKETVAWINDQIASSTAPFNNVVTYVPSKCERDIGYIIDALLHDIRYGGNERTVETIKKYWLNGEAQLDGDRQPEVATYEFVKGLINNYILTRTLFTTLQSGAGAVVQNTTGSAAEAGVDTTVTTLLNAVKAVIQNGLGSVPAFTSSTYPFGGYTYDAAKCKRDIGYLIEAYKLDINGGGNAETIRTVRMYWLGNIAQVDGSRVQEVQTHAFIKTLINTYVFPRQTWTTLQSPVVAAQVLTGQNGEGAAVTKFNTLSDIVTSVIQNGLSSVPALSYNYNATFVGYTYDAAKCRRDSGYIVDSYIYDLEYGGNSSICYVAGRYWINGVAQIDGSRAAEIAAHTFARDLILNYIFNNSYHPSYQIATLQTALSNDAESTADAKLTSEVSILTSVIQNGLGSLPRVDAPNSQNGGLLPNAVAILEANKRYIAAEAAAYISYNVANDVVPFVFFTYNANKCERDVSYIIEGYITDLMHGGNRQTVHNASKYWENGVAQVDGDRQPEISVHTFIKDLIDNYIFANTAFNSRQTLVSQVIDPNNVTEYPAYTRMKELNNTVVEVIQYGLSYLPDTVSNRGYIKVPGFYRLKDFLLVTNTTRNTILYNFADPTAAAEVTYSEFFDSDFPGALYGTDKVTTLTFDADTTNHMVTDNIQVFVEGKEQAVRFNPIATDAMERMKVGLPQSMLDADFEYGLQPTKWQVISTMRNYPSMYEVPGTDIPVVNVTTDASSGTGGVGASLLTVTTDGAHGLTVGTPITVKALANTVLGFSRAEGSFLVNSVPSNTTFTYYAKSKVGTSNGQLLATGYTQLRKGAFYTGAAVGTPTFSIFSNGSSGTITTSLITQSGSDFVGFTGSVPPVGAPVSGTGINTGTQVTAVVGNGGTAASSTLAVTAEIGATQITVDSTAGLVVGLVFDRGDGRAIQVTNVQGYVVSLSGALTSRILGTSATYNNLSAATNSGTGTGAVFSIARNGAVYTTTVTTPGQGYTAGDVLTVLGTSLEGLNPTNTATITVDSANPKNRVATFNAGTLVPSTGYQTTTGLATTTNGSGTGLTVNITKDGSGSILTVSVNSPGGGYAPGDLITILSGVPRGVVINIGSINTPGTGYTNPTYAGVITSTGGSGVGLLVDITTDGNSVIGASVSDGGSGYVTGDLVTLTGAGNGDAILVVGSVTADGSIEVATISAGGQILTVSTTGTPLTAPTRNFISSVTLSEAVTAQIASGTSIPYSAIATVQIDFATAHGFIPGNSITVDITSTGSNHNLAAGPFYVEQVPTATRLRYTAKTAGTIDGTGLNGIVYARPDSYYVHRPFDGGVQLGTGGPAHGAGAVRMSKKYIRYQSGKGIMYNTGALFAPSYDIRSMSATGTAVGSIITLTTDDTDHGCQVGAGIVISGSLTSGYNGVYTVTDIVDERTLKVLAQRTLGATSAVLDSPCQMAVRNWHGATVRAGAFDDQNGMFWQYDGQRLSVVRRTSTSQIAGVIAVQANSNLVTGTNTRFTEQLAQGDRIVIRGMSHVVTQVVSDTSITIAPDYRGSKDVSNAKCCKTLDIIVPQEYFNGDQANGTGPSGYNIDINKMQMIGMQYTWYGAGFIDFMLRGADGNYIFLHRFRTSNTNTEAYMRTGNLPVRYEVTNEGAKGKLSSAMTNVQTTIPLENAFFFPNAGTVIVDNEMISYTGNNGTTLTGCTRAATLTQFVSGSQRVFTGGTASTHAKGAGVILISNTVTPIISHWGSAFMTDGRFDEDRGYIFNYAATNVSISTTKQTAFLIRLAPSVSNAIVGDLGERELINRAQLLLKGIEITSDTGTGGIVVEGVLNPQNYPLSPTDITWSGLSGSASGGQPSFAQIALGGSVAWAGGGITTTADATTQANMTGIIEASQNVWGSNRAFLNGQNSFFITQANYNSYIASGLATGDTLTGTGIPNNTTISSINFYGNVSGTNYYRVFMSQSANQNVTGNTNVTVTRRFATTFTSTVFFQQASWETTGAKAGTEVSDVKFPANTFVSTATTNTFFGTTYYRVTFTQTSNATAFTPGTTAVTFKFGLPAYAQPGETVFSFISAPGGTSNLDLSELKELTNTTLGGRGTYPNGPDVLAINVYKSSGSAINSNIVLRWGEAQA